MRYVSRDEILRNPRSLWLRVVHGTRVHVLYVIHAETIAPLPSKQCADTRAKQERLNGAVFRLASAVKELNGGAIRSYKPRCLNAET